MQTFNFKNTGEKNINDVIHDQLFDLVLYDYKFSVLPKTKFWRFGLRLSKSEEIRFSETNRHGNTEFVDIHLGTGLPENAVWKDSNALHLVHYHIPNLNHTISLCNTYVELSTILFEVSFNAEKKVLLVNYKTEGCGEFQTELKLVDFKYFKIFAWADNIEFDLTCNWEVYSKKQAIEMPSQTTLSKNRFNEFPPVKNKKGVIGVEELAVELADLILKLPNEEGMMLGVFGKWGRGKTYLLDYLWKNLEKNKQPKFEKVNFHTWKYQDTPATWAYLYEVCADAYFSKNSWFRFLKVLKLNACRKGYFPVVSFLILLFSTYFLHHLFLFFLERATLSFFVSLGFGLIFSTLHLYTEFKPKAIELFHDYTSKVSFENYLGVQAEIQKELRFLFRAWIGTKRISKQKVLLLVDDIDRCEESKIMQIIDSLRVMLEDKLIYERVIVIAAIDEEVLKRAIRWKYSASLDSSFVNEKIDKVEYQKIIDKRNAVLEDLVKEYMDKLFVSGIKLGVLSEEEVKEMFSEMCSPYSIKVSLNGFSDATEVNAEAQNAPEKKGDESNENDIDGKLTVSTDEVSTSTEFKIFEKFLLQTKNITPRKMRIMFFRYILARNLLNLKYGKSLNYWNNLDFSEDLPRLLLRFSLPENMNEIESEKLMLSQSQDFSSVSSICFEGLRMKEDYLKLLSVLETVIVY